MPSMTTVKCAKCKKPFQARTADVNRGWGKFCSKSCRAQRQTTRRDDKFWRDMDEHERIMDGLSGAADPYYTGGGWG